MIGFCFGARFQKVLPCRQDFLDFSCLKPWYFMQRPCAGLEFNVRYLFEDYALDIDRRELLRGTGLVSVEPQVFDLLLYLIRNRERVVSRDDLLASVWQGRIVSESALSTRINAARSCLATMARSNGSSRRCPEGGCDLLAPFERSPASPSQVH